jgi:hypothetical protein
VERWLYVALWTVDVVRRRLGGGEQKVKGAKGSGDVGPGGEMTLRTWKIRLPTTTHRGRKRSNHVKSLRGSVPFLAASLITIDLLQHVIIVAYVKLYRAFLLRRSPTSIFPSPQFH